MVKRNKKNEKVYRENEIEREWKYNLLGKSENTFRDTYTDYL